MPLITSRQNPLVRRCRAIADGDPQLMLLDGWHLVADAFATGLPLEMVAVRADFAEAHAADLNAMSRRGVSIAEVSASVMDALSPVRTPSGIVAIANRPTVHPRALLEPHPALVVAGIGVQDPGNVGALIRSADAGGGTGVWLDRGSADPFSWKALRAAMGSAFRLPVLREADTHPCLVGWREQGLSLLASEPESGVDLYEVDLTGPLVLLVGAEGAGLPPAILDAADLQVRIPMRARVESLNVAVAAALFVYEAARQRAQELITHESV
jgi:TrmH family RNA methyltransferase